jgi:hypothetical protein
VKTQKGWFIMQTVSNLLLNGNTPVTVGGTGTTAKFFPPVPGPSINVNSTKVGYIYPQGNNASNNQRLHVMATGNVTPDPTIACPTFRIELVATKDYLIAAPVYVSIVDSTADALGETTGDATATQPWMIDAWLSVDGTGTVMQGYAFLLIGGDVDVLPVSGATGGLSNTFLINGGVGQGMINGPEQGSAPFALAVRATFGTSAAGNTASMYQFALEQ